MKTKIGHTVKRTDCNDGDFQKMIQLLERELRVRNGTDVQTYFEQYNVIKDVDTVVLVYVGDEVAGCGCFKKFDEGGTELKRMFVVPAMRGMGIADSILRELESWAAELGYQYLVLETGTFLVEAVGLYKRHGFEVIPNWGQYIGIENSVCMRKELSV